MAPIDKEQRSFPRTPIELKVEYKKLNTFFHDYTRNISKGGTFIKTARPLPVGTQFIFTLIVPKLVAPLSLNGRVKWILTEDQVLSSDHSEPGMGIEFVYETEEQRQQVDKVVEDLMVKQLGELAYAKLMGKE